MRPSPLKTGARAADHRDVLHHVLGKTVARAALAAVRERSAELCKLKPEILRIKRSCIASV